MRIIISLIFLSLLSICPVYATGPSYINSEMNPVAVNTRGDVLCYTRFVRNEMGAHHPMPIVYGYCILTQDTIIHYTMKVLEWDDENTVLEDYEAEQKLWEAIYKGSFKEKYLTSAVREKYKFESGGVAAYKTDKMMSLSEFKEKKGIDLRKTRQKALFGGVSKNNYSQHGNKVYVRYDFGNVIILQNNII